MNNHELDHLYLTCEEKENATESSFSPDFVHSGQTPKRPGKHRSLVAVVSGIMIGVLLCAGVMAVTSAGNASTAAETTMDYQDKIDMILSYLEVYYLDGVEEEQLGDILARGLMENIGDKYAEYYTREEFDRMMEESSGEYSGIGLQIVQNEEGDVEVYKVYEGSPAQEAGIQLMDVISEAAGVRDFETLDDLVSLVRGEEGTTVDLVIRRGEEEIPMTVERRSIEVDSVYGEILADSLGYIAIGEFNTATINQFRDTVDKLMSEGMEAAVIDMRGNPGGDYDSVVAVCDQVLPEGPIVTVEDKLGGVLTENSDANCLDIPMILLIDDNTASAAELFTMALTDYEMAQTVGTTTYGKGIVQSIFRLPDGSGLKFTTEKYYGPKGSSIQDTGIEPDFVVEFPEEVYEDGVITMAEDIQLQKAAELLGYNIDFEALMKTRELEDDIGNTDQTTVKDPDAEE